MNWDSSKSFGGRVHGLIEFVLVLICIVRSKRQCARTVPMRS